MEHQKESFTDEELALDAQAGSRRCFDVLVERYGPKLYQYLRAKIPSNQDREDIIQETFMKLYRSINRYDPRWKFSTWIFTAANRMAISHYRSSYKKIPYDLAQVNSLNPEEITIAKAQKKSIWQAAAKLRPSQYEVLWLHYAEDMSTKQIARIMKRSSLAVRSLLHRARLSLEKKLREKPGGDEELAFSKSRQITLTENQG